MKKARKALSFLLCLVLIVGILPVSVLADEPDVAQVGAANISTLSASSDETEFTVSRSKTATQLDTSDWTSEVTLSLPSAEEKLESDVVFVLDGSSSTSKNAVKEALELLTQLKQAVEDNGAAVNVCVVKFKRQAFKSAWFDLSTDLASIRTAMDTKYSGGSNIHAGLLAGKEALEDHTDVSANRKYLILISDGSTYLYSKDGDWANDRPFTRSYYTADSYKDAAGGFNDQGLYNPSAPNCATTYHKDNVSRPTDTSDVSAWQAYFNDVKARNEAVNEDGKTGNDYDYRSQYNPETESWDKPDDFKSQPCKPRTANNRDMAYYYANQTWQEIKSAGYNAFSIATADGSAGAGNSDDSHSFMNYLNEGKSLNFSDIQNEIIYAVGAGSRVVDTMGDKFDFVGLDTMTLKVGDETLTGTISTDTVTFAHNGKNDAYVIVYDKAADSFTWTINENVSNFAPVKLTYTVELTNPETAEGTYGVTDLNGDQLEDAANESYNSGKALYTNDSAILTPKDSQNVEGKTLEFPKPSVSYSVDSNGDPILPIVSSLPILWLNMEDHYSYIVGYPDGTVQPNGKITRAEVATIFFRLLSDDTREAFWSTTNDYSDVTADKWYNNAVSTLSRLGVISGYPDGTFRPDASITRAEFAKIAVSFCKYGSTTYSGCFSDVKATDWFSTCVETAKTSNLIAGYPDGTFRPNSAITRAEACTIVNRTLGRKPAKNHLNISGRINWPDCVDTDWFYADIMEATNSHDYQMVGLVEDWNRKLPQRDWAALETEWSHAYSAPGGEVGR